MQFLTTAGSILHHRKDEPHFNAIPSGCILGTSVWKCTTPLKPRSCATQAADNMDIRKFNGEESFVSFENTGPKEGRESPKL